MSEDFKEAFPATLFRSFIIIKAVAIGCLNFPVSISLETVLSKLLNQKIKCNIIPGRNGSTSFNKNKMILSSAVNPPFFFPLSPFITSKISAGWLSLLSPLFLHRLQTFSRWRRQSGPTLPLVRIWQSASLGQNLCSK